MTNRSPILEHATWNPIPTYAPPDDWPGMVLITNAGAVLTDDADNFLDITEPETT
jgi:hypothetical protein